MNVAVAPIIQRARGARAAMDSDGDFNREIALSYHPRQKPDAVLHGLRPIKLAPEEIVQLISGPGFITG